MTIEDGLIFTVIGALVAVAAAMKNMADEMKTLRQEITRAMDQTNVAIASMRDSGTMLNANILVLMERITQEASRSRDDVIRVVRQTAQEQK